jgi:hypothetical protein
MMDIVKNEDEIRKMITYFIEKKLHCKVNLQTEEAKKNYCEGWINALKWILDED